MERLEELTTRWLDGSLTAAEEAELNALCRDEAFAERVRQLLQLEAALRGMSPAPPVTAAAVARLTAAESFDLNRAVMRTIGQLPPPSWAAQGAPQIESPNAGGRWLKVGLPAALAAALLIALSTALLRTGDDNGERTPRLASVTGEVEVVGAENRSHAAVSQAVVQQDQTVVAQEDEQAVLTYPDGTSVELFGPAKVRVESDARGRKRLNLLSGSIHLDVRPQPLGLPLIVGTPQGEARVLGTRFRLATGLERTRIEMEEGKVAFSDDGGRTVEVAKGASVLAEESQQTLEVEPLPPTLASPRWSRDKTGHALAMAAAGDRLAVSLRQGGFLLLDAETGEHMAEFASPPIGGSIDRFAFSRHDLRTVALNAMGGKIHLNTHACYWDLGDGAARPWDLAMDAGPLRVVSPGGKFLGATIGNGWQPTVRLWRALEEGGLEHVRDVDGTNDIWAATFNRSEDKLVIGTRIGWMTVIDVATGNVLWRQRTGTEAIRRLAISQDDRWLAVHAPGIGVQVWSLETSELTAAWLPEGPAARALAFSPDSRQLAAGLADRTVRFWSIPDSRPTLLIETGSGGADQIAFTPDGRRLATAGHAVAVWELP